MPLHITITREPLAIAPPTFPAETDSGAWLDFYGVVRGSEKDTPISGLNYETYETMARQELERLAQKFAATHSIQEAWIVHRVGFVPAGEPSLHLRVRSKHRSAALDFTRDVIDEMKRSVPIWKKPAAA